MKDGFFQFVFKFAKNGFRLAASQWNAVEPNDARQRRRRSEGGGDGLSETSLANALFAGDEETTATRRRKMAHVAVTTIIIVIIVDAMNRVKTQRQSQMRRSVLKSPTKADVRPS